ncbi:MAG TPA: DUF1737 domain-containing protein [Niastella sp.]
MTDYTILEETDRHKLVKKVNEYIAKGWIPLGGVAIAYRDSAPLKEMYYVQALIKN